MDVFTLLEEYIDYQNERTLEQLRNMLEEEGKVSIKHYNYEVLLVKALPILVSLIAKSDKITSLGICDHKLSTYGNMLVPALSKLTILALSNTEIGLGSIHTIANGLAANTTLTDLYLPKNHIGDDGARSLATALTHNSTLTFLDLSGNHITSEGAQHLCAAMSGMPKLENLYLNNNPLGPNSGTSIAMFIEQAVSLEILDLKCAELGNEGIKQIAPALEKSATLNTLDIAGNSIGQEGFAALGHGISTNKSILTLRVARNDFDNSRLEGLHEMLSQNTTLKEIDINWSGISKSAVATLCTALPTNQTLTSVDLSKNRFNDTDLKELSDALLFTSIVHFDLLDNNVENDKARGYVVRPLNVNKVCEKIYIGKQMKVLLNSELLPRELLSAEEMYQFVVDFQAMRETTKQIKLALVGNSGIGKTTLLHYLPHFQKSFWEQAKEIFRKAIMKYDAKPTVGIDEFSYTIGNGKVVAWDFSGKDECLAWLPHFLSTQMTLFLVCFDLGADTETQKLQIGKWLEIIEPLLAQPGPRKIIIVGLRSDKKVQKKAYVDISQWKSSIPGLHDKIFEVSRTDRNSIKKLWLEVVKESERIMDFGTNQPAFYSALLRSIQLNKQGIIRQQNFHEYGIGQEWKESVESGLSYLHSIGNLVWVNETVCSRPIVLSKKLATGELSLHDLPDIVS